jgi:hypothetical protein
MKSEEFVARLMQMKIGPVPQRPVFIWTGTKTHLEELIKGLETHRTDMVQNMIPKNDTLTDHRKFIQNHLNETCRDYQKNRQEPSILIIENSILLARYSCDLSVLFKSAVSPRSAAVLMFPQESGRDFPPRTEAWVKRSTKNIMKQLAKQLGDVDCIVDVIGGD